MSDDDDYTDEDSAGIASLRKEHAANKKAMKEMADELAAYRTEKRSTSVAAILKAKGIPAGAAKLYSGDDTSEDAVGKWLEEYADVFGGGTAEPDPNARSAERVANASFGNVASMQNGPSAVLGDPESVMHAIRTMPYDELVKLGYMPKPGTLHNPVRHSR